MAQQTAVDWLRHQLYDTYNKEGKLPLGYTLDLVKQAKQMEKEQIQKAFSDGQETPMNHPTLPHYSRDEYYNETFVK